MSTAARQNRFVGDCLYCDLRIHGGMRGWLRILEDDFADRYACSMAPDGKHVAMTTHDVRQKVAQLFKDMGGTLPPKPPLQRSLCTDCGHEIAWLPKSQSWSDIFFDGDEFVKADIATGAMCTYDPAIFRPHTPSMSFMLNDLEAIGRILA